MIFKHLTLKIGMDIIKYNKNLKDNLGYSTDMYKNYYSIMFEIIPKNNITQKSRFINFDPECLDITLINDNNQIKIHRNYLQQDDKAKMIKITLKTKTKTLKNLFFDSDCIKEIRFKRFYRNDIIDISGMFMNCKNIEIIKFDEFKTCSVIDMSNLFMNCFSVVNLDLSGFETSNVNNMKNMCRNCGNLININISSFNTKNVLNMSYMFGYCQKINIISLSNFKTEKVVELNLILYFSELLLEIICYT